MIWFWPAVIKSLLDAAEPRRILEIGAARGHNTRNLLGYAQARGCVVHVIDPVPGFDVKAYQEEFGDSMVFHQAKSHEAIPEHPLADVVLIDGDHNWYTVHRELELIEEKARSEGRRFPVVLFHDVSWPYARRDAYYNPDDVPEEFRQPHRKANIVLGERELNAEKGINGGIFNAELEGTPRNGVLTAIEDFIEQSEISFEFRSVRGFAGLGVLIPTDVLADNERLRREFDRLHDSEFLLEHTKRMERMAISSQMAAAHAKRQLRRAELRLKKLERNPTAKEPAVPNAPAVSAVEASNAGESGVPDPAGDRKRSTSHEPPGGSGNGGGSSEKLRVAAIAGETLRQDLADVCDLVPLASGQWRDSLEANPPAILLVESVAPGCSGAWADGSGGDHVQELVDLLTWCSQTGLPTVFWATVESSSIPHFYEIARRCDRVFVADPDAAPPLWNAIGTGELPGVLQLAAPVVPGESPDADRENRPVYVGGWSSDWSDPARRTLAKLLDAAMEQGLRIFAPGEEGPETEFPSRYTNAIVRIPDDRDSRLAVLRQSTVAIGFHPDALTARHQIPRVVFECLACGAVPIIAPGNSGARHVFADAVVQVRTAGEAYDEIKLLLGDPGGRAERIEAAHRLIDHGQTYEHRLATIASAAGSRIIPELGGRGFASAGHHPPARSLSA